jgi:hypothetical protein
MSRASPSRALDDRCVGKATSIAPAPVDGHWRVARFLLRSPRPGLPLSFPLPRASFKHASPRARFGCFSPFYPAGTPKTAARPGHTAARHRLIQNTSNKGGSRNGRGCTRAACAAAVALRSLAAFWRGRAPLSWSFLLRFTCAATLHGIWGDRSTHRRRRRLYLPAKLAAKGRSQNGPARRVALLRKWIVSV